VAGDPRRGVLWPDRPISPPRAREISLYAPGGIAGYRTLPGYPVTGPAIRKGAAVSI